MIKILLRIFCIIATLISFFVSGLSLGLNDLTTSIACFLIGSISFVLSIGKRVTWTHRCIVYGFTILLTLIHIFNGNFSYASLLDATIVFILSQFWYLDFKEVRGHCKPPSS